MQKITVSSIPAGLLQIKVDQEHSVAYSTLSFEASSARLSFAMNLGPQKTLPFVLRGNVIVSSTWKPIS